MEHTTTTIYMTSIAKLSHLVQLIFKGNENVNLMELLHLVNLKSLSKLIIQIMTCGGNRVKIDGVPEGKL